uniref:Uncharacterized protein n=1 Tax=Arundo donax TaxID=35708 RepID=A0A0A9B2P4_ARUDO
MLHKTDKVANNSSTYDLFTTLDCSYL